MPPLRNNTSVIFALTASAAVHLTLIVPLFMAAMSATGTPQRFAATFSSEALIEPDRERDDDRPRLGIEKSAASTLTWIGYEEYQEHLARLAEIEQAAFTDQSAGAEQAVPAEAIEIIERLAAIELPAQLPQVELPSIARLLEAVGLFVSEHDRGESPEQVEVVIETERPLETATTAAPTEPADDSPRGEPGDTADKQSEPTSTIEARKENWDLGRPLAAEGLELKPQRPQFTIMQRLTVSPCNPLVEMRFDRAGVVRHVAIVESSRDRSVDAAIEASAYRWRARGESLEALDEDETVDVRIRFILNASSRCP